VPSVAIVFDYLKMKNYSGFFLLLVACQKPKLGLNPVATPSEEKSLF
jgi:hypothetical protein